jgi:hypothetical protein
MKQLNILRKLIKETIDEMAGETAGAPVSGFYLTPNYKEKLAAAQQDPQLAPLIYTKGGQGRLSTTVENIIGALEALSAIGGDISTDEEGNIDSGIASLQQIATKAFGAGTEQQAVFQPVKRLVNAGVVEQSTQKYARSPFSGKLKSFTKSEKPIPTGIRGRKKEVDADIKMMGAGIINKFSRGNANYTPEEVAYIKDLFKSLKK